MTLTMVQSYGALERMQTVIVGILLATILLAMLVSQPDWLAALYGSVVPSIHALPTMGGQPVPRGRGALLVDRTGDLSRGHWRGNPGLFWLHRHVARKSLGSDGAQNGGWNSRCAIGGYRRKPCTGTVLVAGAEDGFGCFVHLHRHFTLAFMILGASLLHPKQIVPSGMDLLSVQAEFLTQLHPKFLYLYQFGVSLPSSVPSWGLTSSTSARRTSVCGP